MATGTEDLYWLSSATAMIGASEPATIEVTSGRTVPDLESALVETLGELVDELEGTIGVVVPVARRSQAERWLAASPYAGQAVGDDARLVVLTGLDTKGLEFDGIVVVQPQEIEDESPTGRATLYVVLTRATQRLVTLSQA